MKLIAALLLLLVFFSAFTGNITILVAFLWPLTIPFLGFPVHQAQLYEMGVMPYLSTNIRFNLSVIWYAFLFCSLATYPTMGDCTSELNPPLKFSHYQNY